MKIRLYQTRTGQSIGSTLDPANYRLVLQRAYPEPGMAEIVMAEPDVPLFSDDELNDKAVIAKLHNAIRLYEDGAIVEAKDTLIEVIKAIRKFEETN